MAYLAVRRKRTDEMELWTAKSARVCEIYHTLRKDLLHTDKLLDLSGKCAGKGVPTSAKWACWLAACAKYRNLIVTSRSFKLIQVVRPLCHFDGSINDIPREGMRLCPQPVVLERSLCTKAKLQKYPRNRRAHLATRMSWVGLSAGILVSWILLILARTFFLWQSCSPLFFFSVTAPRLKKIRIGYR